eukprot:scaffold22952_cov30-Tisochrysis_lutea.AAC.1
MAGRGTRGGSGAARPQVQADANVSACWSLSTRAMCDRVSRARGKGARRHPARAGGQRLDTLERRRGGGRAL